MKIIVHLQIVPISFEKIYLRTCLRKILSLSWYTNNLFSTTINIAGIPVVKKGWVEGRSLVVYEKQIFTGKRNRYFFDSEAVMSWGLQRKLMEQGFMEAGKTYEIKVYSPDLGMKVPVLTKIVCYGRKEIKLGGQKISAYEVDMEMKSSFGSILTKSWLSLIHI